MELPPLDSATKAKKRYLILKLDDLAAHNYNRNMKRTADYLKSRNLPGTFGICVKSLENAPQAYPDWIRANAYQNGGLFEFWQHGWDHAMNIKWKGKTYTAEFAVEDADYQRERFDKSQSVFLDRVGIPLQGFNAPCGVTTSHTLDILRDHPEITCTACSTPLRRKKVPANSSSDVLSTSKPLSAKLNTMNSVASTEIVAVMIML